LRGSNSAARKLGLVCTTISAATPLGMVKKAVTAFSLGTDLVEFRFDLLREPDVRPPESLAQLARRSVFTVRRKDEGGGFAGSEAERTALLSRLSGIGPLFVDVELRTAQENPKWFNVLQRGQRTIVSWHSLGGTPGFPVLQRAKARAASLGKVAKIVTTATSFEDSLRVLRLYESNPLDLVAFCTGSAGAASRLVSMQLGSPIIYASLPDEPVAPGQISVETVAGLKRIWGRGVW